MKKVAFVASVMIHFKSFHLPYLNYFQEQGFETTVIARDDMDLPYCDKKIKVPFERFPLKKSNLTAYKKLKELFNIEKYDIIHCHTPVAALLTRLAARKARKNGTKVIYTAHGFHFFKGAPLINWLIYFPIEWVSSFFTDTLITINKEDYSFAKKYLHAKNTHYIPGVGVNFEKFTKSLEKREEKRKEIGLPPDSTVIFSVGELNKNKNHEVVLRGIAKLQNKNLHYCIAGVGINDKYLLDLASTLGVSENFHLLGFRTDLDELLPCCDIFCFPSLREGLPVSVMEAMAVGLPCVVSKTRGNVDLIEDNAGGFICEPTNPDEFAERINQLVENSELCKKFGDINIDRIKAFSLDLVKDEMSKIYKSTI